jgi:ATP-dependent Clp protease protease subunit
MSEIQNFYFLKTKKMVLIPSVIEKTKQWERSYDIYSRLLEDRIIFITNEIEPNSASSIVAQLLFLEKKDPDKDIIMYINSPGWHVNSGFAIYDTMQHIKCDITTVCIWMAASFGAVLLTWGTKWKRYCLPHSEVMIHQPLWWAKWQATDIAIVAENILKWKKILNELMAKHTWQPIATIANDMERDKRMDAKQALEYWLIDKIIE